MTFDTERFIREVEVRPPLWDMSSEDYSNAEVRKTLWEQLADVFGPSLMTEEEREDVCCSLQKKWKNIRDCFTRELRRLKSEKNSVPLKRKNPYIYFDHLKFLKTTVSSEPSLLDAEPNSFSTNSTEDVDALSRKRKKEEDTVDKQLLEMLSNCNGMKRREDGDGLQADDDRLFLLSLLHDLKQVPEEQKLRTKIELMIVLDKAKRGGSSFDYAV